MSVLSSSSSVNPIKQNSLSVKQSISQPELVDVSNVPIQFQRSAKISETESDSKIYQMKKTKKMSNEPLSAPLLGKYRKVKESTVTQVKKQNLKVLDDATLKKLFRIQVPSDLISIRIAGQKFQKIDVRSMILYSDVIYIDASDNRLQLDDFEIFPNLIELHLAFSRIDYFDIDPLHFLNLKILNLSFNKITQASMFALGYLPSLCVLDLTGNGMKYLPKNISVQHFPNLHSLLLDNNKLFKPRDFYILSCLPKLKILSMKSNKLFCIPFIETCATTLYKQLRKEGKYSIPLQRLVTRSYITLDILRRNIFVPDLVPAVKQTISEIVKLQGLKEWTDIGSDEEVPETETVAASKKKFDVSEGIPIFSDLGTQRLPFPELEKINLQNNKFRIPEALVAVHTWPKLKEIMINQNPVTLSSRNHFASLSKFLVTQMDLSYRSFYDSAALQKYPKLIERFVEMEPIYKCHHHKPRKDKVASHDLLVNLDSFNTGIHGILDLPTRHLRLCQIQKLREVKEMKVNMTDAKAVQLLETAEASELRNLVNLLLLEKE